MKKTALEIYKNSFLYEIIYYILSVVVPRLKSDFIASRTLKVISWFEKNILNNKYLEIFFNTKKVGEAWYASAFYQYTTYGIRRLAFYIPRSRVKFRPYFLGIFLLFVLLFPDSWNWDNFFMVPVFALAAILFVSRYATERIGVIFVLINIIIFIFEGLMIMSIPIAACKTISYFLLAVDLFFLISFAIRTQNDLEIMFLALFVAQIVLCSLGVIQAVLQSEGGVTGVYDNTLVFAEILLLLFPFAFVYPLTLKSKVRSLTYSILVMGITFVVITATQSRAAFVGFFVELIIAIIMIDRRYIPMILLLAPTFSGGVLKNIAAMWNRESTYGNFFQNIIFALRNIWVNGFGVSTKNFVNMYNQAAFQYNDQKALISVPGVHISAIYFNILVDLGAIIMFGFMYYILRIAHSSVTCMFRATFRQKIVFAAGLAALVGISISSLFESNLFEPRVLIMYWAMLGLLRSGRIIKLGVLD